MKPFKKEHGFEFYNDKLYFYTIADKRDASWNVKPLQKEPKVNREQYRFNSCSTATLEFVPKSAIKEKFFQIY